MFQIFKKQPSNIVELIHNEFDTATERLLKEAHEIIKQGVKKENSPSNTQLEDVSLRLEKLGFVNARTVQVKNALMQRKANTEAHNMLLQEQHKMVQTKAAMIGAYQLEYPFMKFLTVEELDRICEKYKLIYAPVSAYIGDVPEKNLIEIEKAPPLVGRFIPESEQFIIVKALNNSDKNTKLAKYLLNKKLKVPKEITDKKRKCYYFNELDNNDLKEMLKIWKYEGKMPTWVLGRMEVIEDRKDTLMIAAPKSDFTLEGLDMKSKFSYAKHTTYTVNDPIVFRYCTGGIQVISKWGLEAEAVTLPIEN